MHEAPRKTLFHFFHSYLEDLHSLPVHIRKILMIVSMIFASTFLGVFSWLLFPPLENVSLPSLDTDQQAINYNQALNDLDKVARDNELGSASKILEVSPASGFIESFEAMKDLIVPQKMPDNLFGHIHMLFSWRIPSLGSQPWSKQLSDASAGTTLKLREFFTRIFGQLRTFQEYVSRSAASFLIYVVSHFSAIISFLSHIVSRITHIMSYTSDGLRSGTAYALLQASQMPSYLSRMLDLLINSLSRTAI